LRILLVNQHYPPDAGATGALMAELAAGLARRGHGVTVLTGRPTYEESRRERPPPRETVHGVDVVRVPAPRRQEGTLGRGLHYLGFAASAVARGLRLAAPDVILATSATPFFGGLAARVLAAAKRVPLVICVQDVHPELSCALGAVPDVPAVRLLAAIEAAAWRGAARVVVISDDLREAAIRRGVDPDRVVTIRNWADPERIVPAGRSALRREAGFADGDFVVQYAGNLGQAQDLETVLEAAAVAGRADDRVRLLVVGAGSRGASVARRVRAIPGARVVPFRPADQVADVLAAADLALVPLRRGLSRWCVPSKIYAVLASGRPVGAVLDRGSEVARTVEEADCGFRVDPGDVEALAREILRLAGDPAAARRLGRNARAWAESGGGLERALDEYERVLRQASPESRTAADAPRT